MRTTLSLLACSFVVAASTISANASPILLTPLASAAAYGTLVVAEPTQNAAPQPLNPGGDPTPFTTTFNDAVYRGGTSALCPTCLNFIFSFTNTQTKGNDPILELTDADFSGFNVAVGYVVGSGSNAPTAANETVGSVETVNFSYGDLVGTTGVQAGQSSSTLVIFTNATNFVIGNATLQDGVTAQLNGLMPEAAPSTTPEPSSLILLGTGLLAFGGAARRKFARN